MDQPGFPGAPCPAKSKTTLAGFRYFPPLSIFSFFEAFLPQRLVPRTAHLSSCESPGAVLLPQILVSILPETPVSSRLAHIVEQGTVCYTIGAYWLSILHVSGYT